MVADKTLTTLTVINLLVSEHNKTQTRLSWVQYLGDEHPVHTFQSQAVVVVLPVCADISDL